MDKYIIEELTKVANVLDNKGLYQEAEQIDGMVKEGIAGTVGLAIFIRTILDPLVAKFGARIIQHGPEIMATLEKNAPKIAQLIGKGPQAVRILEETLQTIIPRYKTISKIILFVLKKVAPKTFNLLKNIPQVAETAEAAIAETAAGTAEAAAVEGGVVAGETVAEGGAVAGEAALEGGAVAGEVAAAGETAAVGGATVAGEAAAGGAAVVGGSLLAAVAAVVGTFLASYSITRFIMEHIPGADKWVEDKFYNLLKAMGYSDSKIPSKEQMLEIAHQNKDKLLSGLHEQAKQKAQQSGKTLAPQQHLSNDANYIKMMQMEQRVVNQRDLPTAQAMMEVAKTDAQRVLALPPNDPKIKEIAQKHYLSSITNPQQIAQLLSTKAQEYQIRIKDLESGKAASSLSVFDKFAKKKKKKWSKDKIERSDDLASRMMASPRFKNKEWSRAFALSRWMENQGYDVKKKPSKPHKKYVSKKKSKQKAAEFLGGLCKIAIVLDDRGLYWESEDIMDLMTKMANDNDLMNALDLTADEKTCENCGSIANFMGDMGGRRYYKCQDCGLERTEDDSEEKAASNSSFYKLAEKARKSFTTEEAKEIGKEIGIDFDKYDFEEFKRGLDVELEHGKKDKQTNVTDDDPKMTGQIAFQHMKEAPKGTYNDKDGKPGYYELLDKMEKELEDSK